MLFNSHTFIFLYLPVVFVGFFWLAQKNKRWASLWLAVASLYFYAKWNALYTVLLLTSIGFNFTMGKAIYRARLVDCALKQAERWLFVAIAGNLLLLGYFKYTNFFITTANQLLDGHWPLVHIILPLGISFFTFTQIAYLVDVYKGIVKEYDFGHYLLFVTYFPHLIAGPILHHKQMMPQFDLPATYKLNIHNINIGLTIFAIGLCKKVILADQFALYANPIFDTVASPTFLEAWVATLAFSLQLYFDFSGYSDMAIGLSKLFNIQLPLNFNSPYKASSMIDFWQRWHITLSAFLRDYLYIPLGGNRHGVLRRYYNLMITMLLGGLWHGADWNFVIWGGLHGTYLIINHAWRRLAGAVLPSWMGTLLTLLVVMMAWVPFRAKNLEATERIFSALFGINGLSLTSDYLPGFGFVMLVWLLIGLLIVWWLPNTQQWLAQEQGGRPAGMRWHPTIGIAIVIGIGLGFALLAMIRPSPFLYFQF